MRIFLCTAAIFAIAFTSAFAAVETGKPAPDFELKDTNGEMHKLSELKGDYVVLEWLNYNCPFVKKHYKNGDMQALQKTYGEKGIKWLAIASTNPNHKDYRDPENLNDASAERKAGQTAILMDDGGRVGKNYGAKTTPHIFVVDPEGVLVYQGAIDSIASTDSKDIPKAKNYVSECLDAALDGKPIPVGTTKPYGCGVKY